MNLSRTGPQDPNKYDLEAETTHEVDEALDIGGSRSILSFPSTVPTGAVGSLDLFRFASAGVRSFTTSATATAYFSIDSGAINLTNFNDGSGGSDFGDWATGQTPQVQDAFGSPGVDVNLGSNELTALEVVGYNLVSVPEPGISALLLSGLIAIGILRSRGLSSPMWRKSRCTEGRKETGDQLGGTGQISVARILDMPRRIAQERVPTASNVGSRDVTWPSLPFASFRVFRGPHSLGKAGTFTGPRAGCQAG